MTTESLELIKVLVPYIGSVGTILGVSYLTWRSNKKEFQILKLMISSDKTNTDLILKKHSDDIGIIYNKIDDQIIPAISEIQGNIKKNCQAVIDMKEDIKGIKDNCRVNHAPRH